MRTTRGGRVLGAVAMLVGAAVAPLAGPAPALAVTNPAGYVNPLVGTNDGGNVFPGADIALRHGAVEPRRTPPGTRPGPAAPGGYEYDATRIRGLQPHPHVRHGLRGRHRRHPLHAVRRRRSLTHRRATPRTRCTPADFSHADETAEPGYYQVGLDSGVNAELTATARTGSGRFTFPADKPASHAGPHRPTPRSVSTAAHGQHRPGDPHRHRLGHLRQLLRLPRPRGPTHLLHALLHRPLRPAVQATGTWQDDTLTPGLHDRDRRHRLRHRRLARRRQGLRRLRRRSSPAQAPPSTSGRHLVRQPGRRRTPTSPPRTRPARPSTRSQDAPTGAWNDQLGRDRGRRRHRPRSCTTFYTALYHALLHPNVYQRRRRRSTPGMDGKVHHVGRGHRAQYGNFSGWDVYRVPGPAADPAQPGHRLPTSRSRCSTQPSRTAASGTAGLHNASGTHVMNGDPSPAALAGIYAFGGTDFDRRGALSSLVHAAATVHRGAT